MSQPSSIEMSNRDPIDVADPRYISLVMPGFAMDMDDRYFDQHDVPGEKKRITRFYPRVLDLAKLDLARKEVLETCELLENILSFLPAKNIFGVRRVSKLWKGNIAASTHLQERMFLRLENKPHEIWTLETKHKLDANQYRKQYRYLNDTEMKFQRVESVDLAPDSDKKVIAPVTLNPMLSRVLPHLPNVLRIYAGPSGHSWGTKETANFTSWVDLSQHGKSDFWNTNLTDPPCHRASINHFTVCFGKGTFAAHDTGYEHWVPADKWAKADYTPHGFTQGDHIVKAHFILLGQSTMLSDVGLTMGDALKKAFTTTGRVHCGFSDSTNWRHSRATMQDVFDVVKKKLGVESAPKISYIHLQLRLWLVGSHALLIPTEEERVVANENWKPEL
jgi:hypothetical protein